MAHRAYVFLLGLIGCARLNVSQRCDSANYTLINEPRRSAAAVYNPSVDTALCDDGLPEDRWFRFDSYTGDTIPERATSSPVAANRCGTEAPVYIRGLGSHPTVDLTTSTATVCANYGPSACQWSQAIQIHKCPPQGTAKGYFLYKLKDPRGCSIAYCAGEGVPCRLGEYWNGFQCTNYFPPMTGFPILGGPYTNGSTATYTSEVYFTCTIQYTRLSNDTNARFRVTFLFNGQPLETVNVTGTNRLLPFIATAAGSKVVSLGEYYLKGRLGYEISCRVDSYWDGYEPNGNSTLFSQNSYYTSFQSTASSYTFSSSNGSTFTINFQSTIPLTCNHCTASNAATCCRYEFRMIGSAASSCFVRLEGIGRNTTSAVVHLLPLNSQSRATYELLFRPYTGDEVVTLGRGSLWRTYVVPPVKFELIPTPVMYKTCKSYTDPDIVTFDSHQYRIRLVGDFYFVSAKNAQQIMEIQIRLETCNIGSCACGAIIREGNSVYKISMCEYGRPGTVRSPTVVRLLSQEPSDSSTVYRDGTGRQFSFRMPSGLRVEIHAYTHFTIYAHIPPEYQGKTDSRTLCGNSNGLVSDDFVSNHEELRVPDQLNYFRTQPQCSSIYNPSVKSCDCGSNEGRPVFQCSNTDPLLRVATTAQDVLPDRWKSGVVCIQNTVPVFNHLLADSVEEETDFVLDPQDLFPPFTYDPNYGVNVSYSWPTAKGKTEDQAERHCLGLLQSSALYSECSNTSDIASLVTSCITDVQEVDEFLPPAVYVQVMEETCINTMIASINSSEIDDNSTYTMLANIRSQICPNQCSNNGNCSGGNCTCNQGFTGTDCSIKEGVPPTLNRLMKGNVCDARIRPCEVISVLGSGVVSTATLKCRFYNKDTKQYSETTGTFITSGEFSCPVPMTSSHRRRKRQATEKGLTALSQLSVSVTTDGIQHSNALTFNIYDAKCMDCSNNGSCKQKSNTCLIENECFASDEISYRNSCQKCVPSTSKDSWVNLNTYGSWKQCSRECDYGAQSRDVICGNSAASANTQVCKAADCKEKPDEDTEGVGVTLSQADLEKILLVPSNTLKTVSDIISDYCQKNGDVCCASIKQSHSGAKPVTYTSPEQLNYASGYPILNPTNSSLKIIVKIDSSLVKSQCAGTSAAQSPQLIFASKTLIYEIVSKEKSKLEQELGVVLTSVWTPSGSATALKGSSLFIFTTLCVGLLCTVLFKN